MDFPDFHYTILINACTEKRIFVKQLLTKGFCVASNGVGRSPLSQFNAKSKRKMKRIKMTVAALLVAGSLTSTGLAFGGPNDGVMQVNVIKSDAKKVKLQTPGNVEMVLVDDNGTVLYKGQIRSISGKATSVNLTNLPDGHYFLTATNNEFWMSQGLTIHNNQVSIDPQNKSSLVKPTLVSVGKNKFKLNVDGAEKVNVAIYDQINALVFSETYEKGEVPKFDLNRLPIGGYTFVVGPDFKQFTEQIIVSR